MFSMKTFVAACGLAAAIISDSTSAWEGSVTFYDGADFRGQPYTINLSYTDRCMNIGCFNDRASSASWANLPTTDSEYFGGVWILFHTDKDCRGRLKSWKTADTRFPSNFELDGINNAISSFYVARYIYSSYPPPLDTCRIAAAEESGSLSNSTEGNASAVVLSHPSEVSTDLNK